MLRIKSLTMKNFLSIGNVTQSISFTEQDLILVLGENLDLGGNDNRNGVGKSAIVNALSYGLYGAALTNIRKDNLINATNMKNMLVTIAFEMNGINYNIERGRKPGIFKFSKDGIENEIADDESQGEGRNTQIEIERIIGISHPMFKHILALNTYVEPFLALRTNDQREIIEQLLGITKLSEKAEVLKEESRITRDEIKEEEFKISATTTANSRIKESIKVLEARSISWEESKKLRICNFQESILEMFNIDIDNELKDHKTKREIEDISSEYRALTKELAGIDKEIAENTRMKLRLEKNLASYSSEICPKCNQSVDASTHKKLHDEDSADYKDVAKLLLEKTSKRDEIKLLTESVGKLIPKIPKTFYKTIDEAYKHKTTLDALGHSLSTELESSNPYISQIDTLRCDGLQEIDFAKLNDLVKLRDHQDFLLKLLINKDSFIRKKIIDQNLTFLNHRLDHYLTSIGLPHTIKFKSDLEVEISMYGKEFDFDNLSRGERTRLILSLSWSFRDVFESMNTPINLLFIDELIDSGLDASGVESSLAILKKMSRDNKRNIFLISHRDELIGRVSNVLKVVKEGGYTTLESSNDGTTVI